MEFIDFKSRWRLPPFHVIGASLLSTAWLSLGFFRTSATGPAKHTKEPPGHGLDPAYHDSTHDATADTTQRLDPNFSLDPHEILTSTRLEFHNYPASTWSTIR